MVFKVLYIRFYRFRIDGQHLSLQLPESASPSADGVSQVYKRSSNALYAPSMGRSFRESVFKMLGYKGKAENETLAFGRSIRFGKEISMFQLHFCQLTKKML